MKTITPKVVEQYEALSKGLAKEIKDLHDKAKQKHISQYFNLQVNDFSTVLYIEAADYRNTPKEIRQQAKALLEPVIATVGALIGIYNLAAPDDFKIQFVKEKRPALSSYKWGWAYSARFGLSDDVVSHFDPAYSQLVEQVATKYSFNTIWE